MILFDKFYTVLYPKHTINIKRNNYDKRASITISRT